MEEPKKGREYYNFGTIGSIDKINQKVYFKGFTGMQLMGLFLTFAFGAVILLVIIGIYALVVLPVLILPIALIGKKIKEQNDAGNPNYLASLFFWWRVKKKFTDRSGMLQYLMSEDE